MSPKSVQRFWDSDIEQHSSRGAWVPLDATRFRSARAPEGRGKHAVAATALGGIERLVGGAEYLVEA